MPIPSYEDIMKPLLKLANDQQEHRLRDEIETLADILELTEDERNLIMESGREKIFNNRARWASFYMQKAFLLSKPRRGCFKITQRGLEILDQDPPKIDINFLLQFQEFREYKEASRGTATITITEEHQTTQQTPEEVFENAYQDINQSLAHELLEQVKNCSSNFFEKLVLDLLLKMGYGGGRRDAGQTLGQSHDGGVDGVINEDLLGLDNIYIQAKRWQNNVSSPQIRDFIGSLDIHQANKGVFIATSNYSQEAVEAASQARNSKIVLINGLQLAQYMINYDIGVSNISTYKIKKIDNDYFEEIE